MGQEVPLPPRGRIKVQWTVAGETLTFQRPPPNEIPPADGPAPPRSQACLRCCSPRPASAAALHTCPTTHPLPCPAPGPLEMLLRLLEPRNVVPLFAALLQVPPAPLTWLRALLDSSKALAPCLATSRAPR